MFQYSKRGVSLLLVFGMLLMCCNIPLAASAASSNVDTLIELENVKFGGDFQVGAEDSASGGKYIVNLAPGGAKLEDPDSVASEIEVAFEADKEATYYVWLRYSAASNAMDSFFIGFNDEKVASQYGTAVDVTGEGVWAWKMVKSAGLMAGKNTLKMYHRETGLKMDAVYITADASYKPDGGPTTPTAVPGGNTPKPVTPTGEVYKMTEGSLMVEAEAATGDYLSVVANADASGGQALSFLVKQRIDDPLTFNDGTPAASYAFEVEKSGNYSAWLRVYSPSNAMDSIWATFDNNAYAQGAFTVDEENFTWAKVAIGKLDAGVHTFNLVPREFGELIDKVLITNKSSYVPTGMGELPGKDTNYEMVYPTPSFLPPAGHPRVYFTKDDLPKIRQNSESEQNANNWLKFTQNLQDKTDGTLEAPKGATNFSANTLSVIESRAFDYQLRGNREAGAAAVSAMRNFVDTVVFSSGDYNTTGQTVFTIAAVYDWCYDLLSDDDKEFFAEAVTGIASQMEIGWPPTKQGAVTGHGVEAQLMRDLMCAGIAMYDERPDIYVNVAGRFFEEYVDAKLFQYPAHMHNQGNHYMSYRFQWEILCTWIFDRIGMSEVFGADQQYVPYWELYARRPDGQLLRDGDTAKNNMASGTYDNQYYRSFFHAANYFGDPYLKWEAARENPGFKAQSPSTNQSLNPVEFLVFNDPQLEGRPVSELPLSMYYPSPKGGMIARTGWTDGFDSPDVVAEMKINEYWLANHQHLDAGSFQIYYKGALANDTGYYQAAKSNALSTTNDGDTGYGSLHDSNYNKRTIAHNTMLVYDPSESFAYITGNANDGGQRIPNGGKEAATIDEITDPANGYQTGEILGQEFGEDPLEPNYTYLKGDLTKAYSDKIKGYERSFMFLNLKDTDHPAALLVFDRVESSNADFKKTWLLHGLEKPEMNGNRTIFKDTREGYNGKLTVDTLLPKADNASITAVGGEGQEFMVDGVNYPATVTQGGSNEGGGWRMELSPKTASEQDYFLNVLQVGDANPDMPALDVQLIETDRVAGAQIADRVVVFHKAKERTTDNVTFSFNGEGEFEITVDGLQKGAWTISRDGAAAGTAVATEEGGVVAFQGTAGSYTLTHSDPNAMRETVKAETPTHNPISIKVNNRFIYTDTRPVTESDRTLVPMRAIFEALGVNVTWDPETATAVATNADGREVKIVENNQTAYINGEPVELDVPAKIYGDRFLVPVRFVSESFFAKVGWDEISKIVTVTPGVDPNQPGNEEKGYYTIKGCEWSDQFEDSYGPQSYDGDSDTGWSAAGYEGQWIYYDLGESVTIPAMEVMWNKGDQRQAYFDVSISNDAKNWTKLMSGEGSGKAAQTFEQYAFPAGTKARYVRIDCKGNSVSEWNAILEIKFQKP